VAGRRGTVSFQHAGGKAAQAVDGLERPTDDGPEITPFHLISRRF